MKRLSRMAAFWAGCAAASAIGATPSTPPVTVHAPQKSAPVFDGWGTSLCWFANAVGRWPDAPREAIADALFSKKGLGLTVVRYNIGGGENPAHRHMPWFRQMDGYEPSPERWKWDADPGQRWMLQMAIARGADRLEAFSNAPPYWMTVSQCVSGRGDGTVDNLDPRYERAFADYLAIVAAHFRDTWGISFQTLDPFNEPYTDYWKANGRQEGCHFERPSQNRLIKLVRAALDRQGLRATAISASDETNYERASDTLQAYDADARSVVAQINAHAYATKGRTILRDLAAQAGKPLVMSEVDGPGGAAHDHTAIPPALDLAERIIADLRDLRPVRWVFWQAVEDEHTQANAHKNWGLIHADLAGPSHTWAYTKKYYAMANFTKFIRPGAVLLPVDDDRTVAAFDRSSQAVVLVIRNPLPSEVRTTYDVSHLMEAAGRVRTYRTSAKDDLAEEPSGPLENGRLTAVLPAASISTYVIECISGVRTE